MTEGLIVGSFFAIWAVAIGGWIANIVKFAGALSEPITGLEILRALGIIAAPLGCVLGFV